MRAYHNCSVIVIVGPTASGKSAVALEVAKKIQGEIVNADSRQIYQYLNVGTAKPSKEERKEVPHHLYDFLDPRKTYSAGEYAEEASRIISGIFLRRQTAILVGGTGFYIRALFDGLPELPKRDERFRKQLIKLAETKGKNYLHEQLKQVDPVSAGKIPFQNIQRVIRALEVYHLTKQPLSSHPHPSREREKKAGEREIIYRYPLFPLPLYTPRSDYSRSTPLHRGENREIEGFFVGLRWKKEDLQERIMERTKKIVTGIIAETEWLLQNGFSLTDPGLQSLGYREAGLYLQGKISKDALVQQILRRTLQYAKRQMTWFKADKRIQWLDLEEPFHPKEIASRILDSFSLML